MTKVKTTSPYLVNMSTKQKKNQSYNKILNEVACTMISESKIKYTGDVVNNVNKVITEIVKDSR